MRQASTRFRLVSGVGGAFVLVVTTAAGMSWAQPDDPSAATAPQCAVHELPLPNGHQAGTVLGASPDGASLVGSSNDGGSVGAAVIWRGGVAEPVDGAPGALVDMNGSGVAVGDSVDAQQNHHPWVYESGEVRELTGEGTPSAIGEDGRVVGSRLKPTPNGPPVAVPAVWAPGANDPVDLPMPGEQTGRASDIAADGTIVGTVQQDAYVWRPDGTHGPLRRPDGIPATEGVSAAKISGSWVVGWTMSAGVVRWKLETGTVEAVPGLQDAEPANQGINDSGVVLAKTGYDAVTVTDGVLTTLPALNSDRPMSYPSSISADGRVVAGTAQTNGNPSPVTELPVYWTCS
ncbi:hypothetical protein MOQ72_05175 [Saccharopolyspora sp. K220]|uniref:hypothetical protein n=1 Tax=Saccharopolyspora soli TaxID=2926618 RepID=UPI001F59B6A1|nr:hypothetical protein [Saccharopolyspora soli]MCI2416808.1 hypothetical protein [Saccharopolyspora soli]